MNRRYFKIWADNLPTLAGMVANNPSRHKPAVFNLSLAATVIGLRPCPVRAAY
jgi:hypothetical protein